MSAGLTIDAFWIVPIFINLFILSLALSLILSCMYVIAKDINQIWQVVVSFLFFLSPIFYKLSVFKDALPSFEYANPMAGIIINARNVMMYQKKPEWELFFFDFGYSIFLLLLGILFLNKIGSRAAEKV